MGYTGITNALAVEFDTYYNPGIDSSVPDRTPHIRFAQLRAQTVVLGHIVFWHPACRLAGGVP